MKKPKVYLAGPISNAHWRDQIRAFEPITDTFEYMNYETEENDFIVTGPHAIGCDHKCYHNFALHVAARNNVSNDYGGDCNDLQLSGDDVVDACTSQIDRADVVFAFINGTSSYGTLAEIGFAFALGKPIYILFACEELAMAMWFVARMATEIYVNADFIPEEIAVKQAFDKFIKEINKED